MFLEDQSLPQKRSFQWTAIATIDMPRALGGGTRSFPVSGEAVFVFERSEEADIARFRCLQDRIDVPEIPLTRGHGLSFLRHPLTIDAMSFETTEEMFLHDDGFVDMQTGEFTRTFVVNLVADAVPALKHLGIDTLPLQIREAGQFGHDESRSMRATAQLTVSAPGSETVLFSGLFDKCPTSVSLCGTVDGSQCTRQDGPIYICPGDKVHLWWTASPDVEYVTLTPGLGRHSGPGSEVVTPSQDTTYTITTSGGECVRSAKVDVTVVRPGQRVSLIAPYDYWNPPGKPSRWVKTIPTSQCSPGVKVTSLRPACQPGCFSHPHGSNNRDCSAVIGNLRCNALWNAVKIDPDGYPHYFTTGNLRLPVKSWPLAGKWSFELLNPVDRKDYFGGVAALDLTIACKT